MNCSKIARAIAKLALPLLLTASGTCALAQAYPTKAIKFVVPFPAGSATDVVGRIVAQAMGDALGQSTAVENKAGANGILGAESVKAAAGDGYTFLVTTSTTQAANVSLYKKLPYDPVKDFTPIGKIGETGFILMVRSEFPAKDMKEFIAYGKANPGKMAYGHGSSGSLVSAALLGQMAAPDYVDKLPLLFEEFVEAGHFNGQPGAMGGFASAHDLRARTPAFWDNYVKPKIERDFAALSTR